MLPRSDGQQHRDSNISPPRASTVSESVRRGEREGIEVILTTPSRFYLGRKRLTERIRCACGITDANHDERAGKNLGPMFGPALSGLCHVGAQRRSGADGMSCTLARLRGHGRSLGRRVRTRMMAAGPVAPETEVERAVVGSQDDPKLCILYDSDCPACKREVKMLQSRDKMKRLQFTDVSDPRYEASENSGVSYERAMRRIHAITEEGQVITGIDAFRRAYESVGLGWVYAPARFKVVNALLERIYNVWAQYRLTLAGRPTLEMLMEERKEKRKELGLGPEGPEC